MSIMKRTPKPVRTVRIGPIWDEAHQVADANDHDFAEIITAALTRYVARNRKKS